MGLLICDLSNIKVPLVNHSKWSSNNISSVSDTSTNPASWRSSIFSSQLPVTGITCHHADVQGVLIFCCMCSPFQMRSYNRHTLVADPFEDGFGDFILKKQKMIELEKKVRSPVKCHNDKFAINITFSNPKRCVTRESGRLWNGEVMFMGAADRSLELLLSSPHGLHEVNTVQPQFSSDALVITSMW